MNISDKKYDIIKGTVKDLLPDCRIMLFGSRARNESTEGSDYDFMIITKEPIGMNEVRLYKSLLRKKLAKQKIPADILIQCESEIEIKKQIVGHIIQEVIKDGILL